MSTRLGVLMTLPVFFSLCAYSRGQDKVKSENSVSPQEEANAQSAQEGEKGKGEIDRMFDDLKSRNEVVLGTCLEGAQCKPIKGGVADTELTEGEVVAGKIVEKPQPVYPLVAKAARASGPVTIQVIVDEEGSVIAAQAISGHPLLHVAALKAARATRLTPTLVGGKPSKVSGVITYNFVLQ